MEDDNISTDINQTKPLPCSIKSRFLACIHDPAFYPMLILGLLFAGVNADQNLLSPQLSVIGHEFNMTNAERDEKIGGYLSLGFFLVGGFFTILVGYFTDRIRYRVRLLCLLVLIGEFGCFCTLWVTDFWGLFVTRSITGISVGGSQPLIYSMLGDFFVDKDRGKAVSIVAIAYGGGIFIGQTLSSSIGPVLGWRMPFVILASLTIALLPLVYFTVNDPRRGSKELKTTQYHGKADYKKVLQLFKTPTVLLIWLQGIPGSVSWGVVTTYFQDFLVTDISHNAITIQESSAVVLSFAAGQALGTVAGGVIGDWLWLRDKRLIPLMIGISQIVATLPFYVIINHPVMELYVYCLLCFPSGFLIVLGVASLKALLLNTTLPEVRGQAWSGHVLGDDLGKGLGPFWVSLLITGLGSRLEAFNFSMLGWLVCGVFIIFIVFFVRRDVARQVAGVHKNARGHTISAMTSSKPDVEDLVVTNDDISTTPTSTTSKKMFDGDCAV